MKKLFLSFVLLMVLSSQVFANDPFDTTDKALFTASTIALVADWSQTRYIAAHPDRFYEQNPILGRHPSKQKVDLYFAGTIVGNYLIADALPSRYRKLWLGGVLAIELLLVAHNKHIGIKFHF